jgi:HEAT repeat protein
MLSHPHASPVLALFSFCALAASSFAQAPPTVAEALQKQHIELTEPALLQALHSPINSVRGLAAAELAELKLAVDLPAILEAARAETDPLTEVNIAAAATWLGSKEGLQILTRACRDKTRPTWVRIDAARNAFEKQDHTCFLALIDLMRPEVESGPRIEAMSVATQIKPKTPEEARLLLYWTLTALSDADPMVRLEASDSLRWLNDPASVYPLRKAINEEEDKSIRLQMQTSLDYLEHHATTKAAPL